MSVIPRFDIGDLVKISGTFADEDGNPADPTSVTIQYINPAGDITTRVYGTDPEVVRDTVGSYYANITVDAAGYWFYRVAGAGEIQDAAENHFFVKASKFNE